MCTCVVCSYHHCVSTTTYHTHTQGPPGPTGTLGSKGSQGEKGAQGTVGIRGQQGPAGSQVSTLELLHLLRGIKLRCMYILTHCIWERVEDFTKESRIIYLLSVCAI